MLHGNELEHLRACIESGWVSSVGPVVAQFEREVARAAGSRYAVATSSGTAAIHIGLLVAGVEADDEVIMPALTFVAPANTLRYIGAWPIFIDVDPVTWQIDVTKVSRFLQTECVATDGGLRNRTTGRRVRGLMPVHLLGHPCDMRPLLDLARAFGLATIVDATESLGARYQDRPIGAWGDVICLSFNGNKLITTGGGGMILTDSDSVAERARHLTTQAKDDPIEYVHSEIGFNYRLSSLQAALGLAQLEWLEPHIAAKREIAHRYQDGLAGVQGIGLPAEAPWAYSVYWLYTILVDASLYGRDSRSLMSELGRAGIEARPFWRPLYQLTPYLGCQTFEIETSPRLYREGLSIPSSVGLEPADQSRVIQAIRDVTRA